MAREYKYLGIAGSYHEWVCEEGTNKESYFRHIKDEEFRVTLVERLRALGFLDNEIQVMFGQEILFGTVDFSVRNSTP